MTIIVGVYHFTNIQHLAWAKHRFRTETWMHRDPSPTSPRKCPMLLTITSLVVAANTSEKSWSSSVGMMTFPIDGKKTCSSHHQPAYIIRNSIYGLSYINIIIKPSLTIYINHILTIIYYGYLWLNIVFGDITMNCHASGWSWSASKSRLSSQKWWSDECFLNAVIKTTNRKQTVPGVLPWTLMRNK